MGSAVEFRMRRRASRIGAAALTLALLGALSGCSGGKNADDEKVPPPSPSAQAEPVAPKAHAGTMNTAPGGSPGAATVPATEVAK